MKTEKLNQSLDVSLEEGKTYYFCTCGHSEKYPFCDGSHRAADTDKRSMAYDCTAAKKVIYHNGQVEEQIEEQS